MKSTASCLTSSGKPSAPLPLDGHRCRPFATFVHGHLRFDYLKARANRTALDGFRERVGVCRDFTHLAITLCRCMNIPARYATGYLGDIGVPADRNPMDFSAWFEAYLGDIGIPSMRGITAAGLGAS